MPRGTALTAKEQGIIKGLHIAKWSFRAIAKKLNRSPKLVMTYLKGPEQYGKAKRSGKRPKMSAQQKRALLREAHKGNSSSRELVKHLNLPVGPSTVRRILHNTPTLRYSRMACKPMMLPRHKVAREAWARQKVTWNPADWRNVVWSDEKKFNLDGPDGFAYYWHDLRTERRIFSKRQQGGNSIMVWGAFCGSKKCKLVVLSGTQNQDTYINTLETYLLPFAEQELSPSWTFMQDGAACHRANRVYQWFEEEEVSVLDWPAKSPDLNPIENLWGILARKVYANHHQFSTVEELRTCVLHAWEEISEETLKNLVGSMQRRCFDVVMARGGPTKY